MDMKEHKKYLRAWLDQPLRHEVQDQYADLIEQLEAAQRAERIMTECSRDWEARADALRQQLADMRAALEYYVEHPRDPLFIQRAKAALEGKP